MKININIDLQTPKMRDLESLIQVIHSIIHAVNAMEAEIENYRRRLERIEETTTRFEPNQE
jgi:molecular chaperone GrpE (heat shock protein)